MVYDWTGDKREICFQKYIVERQSLEEIMKYFKEVQGFIPSKRAFQTQFKRWEFPSKQSPAHKNEDLAIRVRELWEKNSSQAEMLQILESEGYSIKERELSRLRKKKGLHMRAANVGQSIVLPAKRSRTQIEAHDENIDPAIANIEGNENNDIDGSGVEEAPELPPEIIEKRQKHMEKLQSESDKRYRNHTRRRRTRPWAGLPADPPAPPRFPSETTIDEAKRILGLDHKAYVNLRERFQSVCEQGKIRKKTEAGGDQWQHAKDRLIAENEILHPVFYTEEPVDHTQHNLALDVICSDVTKRMRTLTNRLTIQECKNILKTNPEEARRLRKSFEDILRADHFTSKLEAGPEHWNELKAQWLDQSTHLKELLREGEADPEHELQVKAMELICRDVMKRLRDEHTRKDSKRKRTTSVAASNFSQSPAAQSNDVALAAQALAATPLPSRGQNSEAMAGSAHNRTSPAMLPLAGITDYGDLQIDPKLLLAANNINDPSMGFASTIPNGNYPAQPSQQAQHYHPASQLHPRAIYFRLSPQSPIQQEPKVWLATLAGVPSVDNLRSLALSSHSHFPLQGSISVVKVEGLVVSNVEGSGQGAEMRYPIDEDDELLAYLQHVKGGKATFRVQFV
ncbi:MAG: hypothetical protein Q9195_008995 [Heterodermia aff. obscurata]